MNIWEKFGEINIYSSKLNVWEMYTELWLHTFTDFWLQINNVYFHFSLPDHGQSFIVFFTLNSCKFKSDNSFSWVQIHSMLISAIIMPSSISSSWHEHVLILHSWKLIVKSFNIFHVLIHFVFFSPQHNVPKYLISLVV